MRGIAGWLRRLTSAGQHSVVPSQTGARHADYDVSQAAPPSHTHPTRESALPKVAAASKRIPSLDGLRAISICLVLIGHAMGTVPEHGALTKWFATLFGNDGFGVLVFFVISGFLITRLLIAEDDRGHVSMGDFYRRRIFRIAPVALLYVAVVAILRATDAIDITWPSLLRGLFFMKDYDSLFADSRLKAGNWFVGHMWSLSIEEQFYLFWPFIFLALNRRHAKWFALVVIVTGPLIRIAQYAAFDNLHLFVYFMLHTRMDSLMMGCFIALCYHDAWFERALETALRWRLPLLAILYAFLISPIITHYLGGKYQLTVGWSLENLCVAMLLLWVVRCPETPLGRFLNLRWVAGLGALSYSLYIWQQMFLTGHNHTWSGQMPISLLVVFVVALCSYHGFEKPMIRLGRAWGRRHHAPQVEPNTEDR
ncbi:acyltransferase [Robbsia sp. KACC 23696]|uniref:acyltransferase family protein n=1 Tax=Robbsia sp. KACC 23696 TaxID=3149231 RepID=UPI00325B3A9F